jgi:alpha-mannosidase
MKTLISVLSFFCCAVTAIAQTSVDKVVEQLDFLSKGTLNNWRYSTDFSVDPTKPDFNDSRWDTLRLDQSIYPDSCWIRKEVVLPDRILGEPVHGPIRFLVSVDDYGYLWVNGESKGYFPWDGEFELTRNAKSGEKYVIAIKAINTGGPLRLLRAQIVTESSKSLLETIENLTLSLRVGQKLLSFDTYQTNARVKVDPKVDKSTMNVEEKKRLNGVLQSVAAKIDIEALRKGDLTAFTSSVTKVREELKPIGEFAKRFTLYFDSNAHIDAAWLWREKETIEVCRNTFSSVFTMMDQRPDFTYTQSAAAYYDWMERLYPDVFRKIQQRVKDGRWEVVGGMWVEPDCNLPAGESWARHLLYAKRYFKQKLGVEVKLGWNPDSFGYNWNMPMFYRNAGIDAFITQKIGWNDTNVFPHRLFWWESPDGSRILSYFPFDYVNSINNPYRLVDWMRQHEANTGMTKMLILFGVGDHGGGPSLEMLDRIDRLKTLDVYPGVEYGTASRYLDWLRTQDLSHVPTWKNELYLEYHQGTYTTQAKMKHFNRTSETLLTNAETFSTLSTLSGARYNGSDLEEAWRKLLFNQFHDILPGSSIREVYIDATETHQQAQRIGAHLLNTALDQLSSTINTSPLKKGKAVMVFNPLAWERTDLVTLALPDGDTADYAVFDANGREIPSQKHASDKYKQVILFVADRVPSTGYKTYELRKHKPSPAATMLTCSSSGLENDFHRITIDADSGWVKSILDKRTGRELLKGYGNRLQLLEDKPSAWDAWNIGLTGTEFPSTYRCAEVVEQGPVRCVVRLHRDYLKPGVKKDFPTEDFPSTFFTQDIVLYNGIDRIDFTTSVDWWEEKTMLKVAFPLAVEDSVATYDIPYGTIRRSTRNQTSIEKAQFEVSAQKWADVSTGGFGVSMLTRDKYGYDIKGNMMRLSLLRSPKWPDETADRGKHVISYALYSHAGNWFEGNTVRRAHEYNNELIAVLGAPHTGNLPSSHSFISLTPASLVLTTVKKAEDSDAWIIQWYNLSDGDAEAVLQLPRAPKRAVATDFLEEDGVPVEVQKTTVRVHTGKHAVATVKVEF